MDKPFSQACENNKAPILAVLQQWFRSGTVLEIGSGTGQHAVWFAPGLPDVHWQPSDQAGYLPGIRAWIASAPAPNLAMPLELDVLAEPWPVVDDLTHVFSANTAHIMGWDAVQAMFAGVGSRLPLHGVFCLYGPFNYDGRFTSESNQRFDAHLRTQDPAMGIRDIEALRELARENSLMLIADEAMPANNRLLIWGRR